MKELTEIINAHYENGKSRICPKCSSKLKIDLSSKSLKIFCPNCGFKEPCHLRGLEINNINCSSCPYSPNRKEIGFKEAKQKLIKQFRTKRGVLKLGAIQKLIEENLEYPKLKRKCVQAWNSQSSKEMNSAFI
jgi:hypothetical protein